MAERHPNEPKSAANVESHFLGRWVGAGTLPGTLGYLQATIPLVVLEVAAERLILRVRPRALGRIAGIDRLTAAPGDDLVAFPVKSNRTWQGIEFRLPTRPSFYFWTRSRGEILDALTSAGFRVSDEEGQMR